MTLKDRYSLEQLLFLPQSLTRKKVQKDEKLEKEVSYEKNTCVLQVQSGENVKSVARVYVVARVEFYFEI